MNRDDIIRMARTVRDGGHWNQLDIVTFGLLVAAHERDECARIADFYGGPKEPMMVGDIEAGAYNAAEAIAADIRARGEK